jgi:YHS domain-containing protein
MEIRDGMTSHRRKEVHMKMRIVLVLCLAVMIALSFGCSKKKAETPKPGTAQQKPWKPGERISLLDPVSKEPVDIRKTPYTCSYNGAAYGFSSAQNMEAFKADPEKYITRAEPQQTTPPEGR